VAVDGSAQRRIRLRLVGLVSWGVFAFAWWRVFRLDAMVSVGVLLALGACAALVMITDLWWVAHNRRIYRRKGPRTGRPFLSGRLVRDRLGRPLQVDPAVRRSAEVTVSLGADGAKVYRPEPYRPAGER
jgi:hypothetical protein